MKKWMKIAGVSLLIASTLAVGGCGEEKKYNEAKNKLQPLMEETMNMPFTSSKDINLMEADMKKHKEKRAEVDKKLQELGELAKSDVKLNNDYKAFKEDFERKDDSIWALNQNSIDVVKEYNNNNNFAIGHPW